MKNGYSLSVTLNVNCFSPSFLIKVKKNIFTRLMPDTITQGCVHLLQTKKLMSGLELQLGQLLGKVSGF